MLFFMNNLQAIFFIVVLAAVIAGIIYFQRRKKAADARDRINKYFNFDLPAEPAHKYRTPKGVTVKCFRALVNAPAVLAAVDEGADVYLRSTAAKGWARFRDYSEFEVWMLPATSASIEGFPCLNTLDGQKIAGIAIGVTGYILPQPFVCIAYNETYFDWIRDCCRAEFEHVGDLNDPDAMEEHTKPGHIHFFYNDFAGIVANTRFDCGCSGPKNN